jgi:hypothetical protein
VFVLPPHIPHNIEFPGIIFITLLNTAPPSTPALLAASKSMLSKFQLVKSPIPSTTPEAADIIAPQGPILPMAERIPSLTALSSSGKSDPLNPPINDPVPDNIFCQFLDIPILLP